MLTGAAMLVGCSLAVRDLVADLLGPGPGTVGASLVAAGASLLTYPLLFWTLRGMEVGLLALLATLMCRSAVRTLALADGSGRLEWTVGVLGALGVLTRLDFAVVAAVVGGLLAWWSGRRLLTAARALGPALVAGIAVIGWQASYYGDWLPNTYHLKMDGVPVGVRIVHGLWMLAKLLPLVPLVGFGVWQLRGRERPESTRRASVLLGGVVAAMLAYHVWVGGDAWEGFGFSNRFVAVVLPAALILSMSGLGRWLGEGGPRPLGAGAALLAATLGGVGAGVFGDGRNIVELGLLVTCGLAVAGVTLVKLGWDHRRNKAGARLASLIAGAIVWSVATSLFAVLWLAFAGPREMTAERNRTRDGITLATITNPNASIATWPAGSVAYYSGRRMIDVLGKSDSYIAGLPATTSLEGYEFGFLPGHNKWDLVHSIASQPPDVAYEPWNVRSILAALEGWGYVPLCSPEGGRFYVRQGSTAVNTDSLSVCTPEQEKAQLPLTPVPVQPAR